MGPVSLTFAGLTGLTVAVAVLANRQGRAHRQLDAALAIAATWLVGELICRWVPVGAQPDAFAFCDLLLATRLILIHHEATATRKGRRRPTAWLVVLIVVVLAQMLAHVWYQSDGRHPGGIMAYWCFMNLTYGLQLAAIWWASVPQIKFGRVASV